MVKGTKLEPKSDTSRSWAPSQRCLYNPVSQLADPDKWSLPSTLHGSQAPRHGAALGHIPPSVHSKGLFFFSYALSFIYLCI